MITSNSFRGSLSVDRRFLSLQQNQRSSVGSGALSVVSFMDSNGNESYDDGEKILAFDGIEIEGGGQKKLGKDGVLRVFNLPSNRRINISINNTLNPNPTAVTLLNEFSVLVQPNVMKLIEIPYYSTGVAIGKVLERKNGNLEPRSGIKVLVVSKTTDDVLEARTFSDGGFYITDIPPGTYELVIDPEVADFLGLEESPSVDFEIESKEFGDFAEGLELIYRTDE
jgi:hypothetical protein